MLSFKILLIILILFIQLEFSTWCHGQTTENSIIDGNWNNPSIWSAGYVPTSLNPNIVVISNGVNITDYETAQDIIGGSGFLAIQNGGEIQASNIRVSTLLINTSNPNALGTSILSSLNHYAYGTIQYGAGITTDISLNISDPQEYNQFFDIDTNGNNVSFHTDLPAGIYIAKTGQGTLTLLDDVYNTIPIYGGTVQVGNGGTTGSIDGGVINSGNLVLDRSDTYVFAGGVSGTGNVYLTGSGTVVFVGNSSYTGNTILANGILEVTPNAIGFTSLGSGQIIFTGGTLEYGPNFDGDFSPQFSNTVNQLYSINTNSNNVSFASSLNSNGGTLTKMGAGTLTLLAANTYTGGTTIQGGTLAIGASGSISNSSFVNLAASGATLDVSAGNQLINNLSGVSGSQVLLGGNTLTIATNTSSNFAGSLVNSGSLFIQGSGTEILSGTNSYTGGTTISSGTLEIGNGGTTGSILGDVADNGTLAFNRSDTVEFSGVISGTGGVTQIGSGTTILTASNTYSGGTMISSGTLQIGNGGTAGSILGDVADNGTLAFNRSDAVELSGVISGTGGIVQMGSGTTILTAANTYSGGTTVSSGTLQIGNGGTTGSIVGDVADNGTLAFNHSDDITFNGVISGTGNLIQAGTGSLTLNGVNTYSGGTILQNGTLVLGNSQALGTGPLTTIDPTVVYNNGITISNSMILNGLTTLEVDGSSGATQSGLISGLSGIVKSGTGSLTLSNSNTFTGGTTLNTGSLVIANPNGLGLGNVTQNGGTLMTDGINHTININGNFTQNSGTLGLTIYSPTVYDQVVVSGKASVGGTLALNLPNGLAPGSATNINLIKSNQPVTGKFSSVMVSDPSIGALLTFSDNVTFQPTSIVSSSPQILQLTQLPFGNLYGNYLTSNEHGAASYIDAHDQSITNPSFGNLVAALNSVSPSSQVLTGSFDQLNSLNFHNFASSTAFNNTPFMVQQFDDYLATHRSAQGEFIGSNGGIDDSGLVINDPTIDPGLQTVHSRLMAINVGANCPDCHAKDMKDMVCPEPKNQWTAFASGNVVLGQDFSDSATGLAHADTTSESVQIGADYRITPHLLAGVMFGYGHSEANLDTLGSAARVDTYSPGLYAAYSQGNWYANSLFNYGFSDYTQHRNVSIGSFGGTARSNPSGNQLVLDSDGGYDLHSGRFTYGPTIGLEYVHLSIDGYSESGLPGADLNVNEDQSDSLRSLLGAHLAYNFSGEGVVFTPHLNASWQHEYLDSGRNITSNFSDAGTGSFDVRTSNPSRDSALVALGLDAQINSSINLFSDYTVQAGQSNYFGQSVQAGVSIRF